MASHGERALGRRRRGAHRSRARHARGRARQRPHRRARDGGRLPAARAGRQRRLGAGGGLSTGVASVLAINWFFVPPTGTLTIDDSRGWISLGVFAVTAVITSRLTAEARTRRRESEARRREAELLAGLAETVLEEIGPGPPGPAVAVAAARALGVERCALVLEPGGGRGAGRRGVPGHALTGGFTVPLVAGAGPSGCSRWARRVRARSAAGPAAAWWRPSPGSRPWRWSAAASSRRRSRRRGLRRSDELKTALLQSVSHEFRTPLTAIRTAAHALAGDPSAPGGGPAGGDDARDPAPRAAGGQPAGPVAPRGGRAHGAARLVRPAEMAAGAVEAAEPLLDGRMVDIEVPADRPSCAPTRCCASASW